MDLAKGEYIHFVDGDDFLLYNNSYQKLLEIIKSAETPIDVLRIDSVTYSENYALRLDQYKDLEKVEIEFDGTGRQACHELRFKGYVWASIARRSLIEEFQFRFDANLCVNEDALLFLKLYNYADRVVLTKAAVYGYYKHGGSVTFTKDKKRLLAVIDNLFNSLPQMETALDLYDDPFFKQYRMECQGYAIAKRLLRVPLAFGVVRRYIKRGFDCGVFPVGRISNGNKDKDLDLLLKHPFLFWLCSLSYRYIFVPVIKPLILKYG